MLKLLHDGRSHTVFTGEHGQHRRDWTSRIEYDIQRDLVRAQIELIPDNEPLWRAGKHLS